MTYNLIVMMNLKISINVLKPMSVRETSDGSTVTHW